MCRAIASLGLRLNTAGFWGRAKLYWETRISRYGLSILEALLTALLNVQPSAAIVFGDGMA